MGDGKCLARTSGLALCLAGTAVMADDDPMISFGFGEDVMEVAPDQVLTLQTGQIGDLSYLSITLSADLREALATLSAAHVYEMGTVRVCGSVVSEPLLTEPLTEAVIVITDPDSADILHLAEVLHARDCQDWLSM